MSAPAPARIFISYSRKDGIAFAAGLRKRLEAENLSVWQDLAQMEGGRDWWSQIEEAIRAKATEHVVLVVTPQTLDSHGGKIIRREIRLARQEGKTVSPIRGPGIDDLGELPRWFGHVCDIAIPEQFARLTRVLQGPSTQNRVPMLAPEPPADFVARPAEFDALKAKLLDPKGDAVAITAALKGAGGYGKTTLARKLAHDPDIVDAYFDGILWAELGEKPVNLLSILSDLVEILTGERPGLENLNMAAAKLGEALGDRRILLIVDDAWRAQDLRPFLQGGPHTTRLVTTRNDDVLPANAFHQAVDAMREGEALALLAAGLPADQVSAQARELGKLAARLGEWALLLRLVNGFLRERAVRSRQPLGAAVAGVNQRLDAKGLLAFDAGKPGERAGAVAGTIAVSLDLLDESSRITSARARFEELAVFPEDTDIPIGIAARFWAQNGGLDALDSEDLLSELFRLSLLLGLDLDQKTFRLHDTIRHFLREAAGKEGLVALNQRLVHALDRIGAAPEAEIDDGARRYFYLNLPHHLAEARDRDRLDALLLDPGWLKAKLAATESPHALVADYEQHGAGELHNLIGRTLRLTTGICARDQRQLIPQLLGRLTGRKDASVRFFDAARRQMSRPAILTRTLSLTPPGAETARLEGHTNGVAALCLLPDGRLASSSYDNTIRLWYLDSGRETVRLETPADCGIRALWVTPEGLLTSATAGMIRHWNLDSGVETTAQCAYAGGTYCALPDGRVALARFNIIHLWDLNTGAETAKLEGHTNWVSSLCMLPDGRLASGSGGDDCTIRLWDLNTGAETAHLKGHSSSVSKMCVLPDGRLASASWDKTVRLWDVNTGLETARWVANVDVNTAGQKQDEYFSNLCVLPDGRVAGSCGNSIRVLDVTTGAETARMEGHLGSIIALCVLPSGRLASGSSDHTIRLWDVNAGSEIGSLDGHSCFGGALCVLPDGRLASGSGSGDYSIRLWDVNTCAETASLSGHLDSVTALFMLPDGRLASGSGSGDCTIRLWDLHSGVQTTSLMGHLYLITTLCVLQSGRLASGSYDKTIRLWDVTAGVESASFVGHSGSVDALCTLPDSRLASSGGQDKTIRIWDENTGEEVARLIGHSRRIAAVCLLPDGQLASGSDDATIRLWHLCTAAETVRLEGHKGPVSALCLLADGRLASGATDNTIRLWDLATGIEIARLETDAPILCLAALPDGGLVAGDAMGRLHWLEIVD